MASLVDAVTEHLYDKVTRLRAFIPPRSIDKNKAAEWTTIGDEYVLVRQKGDADEYYSVADGKVVLTDAAAISMFGITMKRTNDDFYLTPIGPKRRKPIRINDSAIASPKTASPSPFGMHSIYRDRATNVFNWEDGRNIHIPDDFDVTSTAWVGDDKVIFVDRDRPDFFTAVFREGVKIDYQLRMDIKGPERTATIMDTYDNNNLLIARLADGYSLYVFEPFRRDPFRYTVQSDDPIEHAAVSYQSGDIIAAYTEEGYLRFFVDGKHVHVHLEGLPSEAKISYISFSPDDKYILLYWYLDDEEDDQSFEGVWHIPPSWLEDS